MAVEIKVDGDDRTFFARCYNCGSDLNYKVADINRPKVENSDKLTPADIYSFVAKTIVCPKCGCRVSADMMAENEYNIVKHILNFPRFGSCR